jgi:hypothetical protein
MQNTPEEIDFRRSGFISYADTGTTCLRSPSVISVEAGRENASQAPGD